MTPRKLSDAEKREIIALYRQPEETTSSLADRYGVSASTISRILKQGIGKAEHEALTQSKRQAGKQASTARRRALQAQADATTAAPEPAAIAEPAAEAQPEARSPSSSSRRRRGRRRSTADDGAGRDDNGQMPLFDREGGDGWADAVRDREAGEKSEAKSAGKSVDKSADRSADFERPIKRRDRPAAVTADDRDREDGEGEDGEGEGEAEDLDLDLPLDDFADEFADDEDDDEDDEDEEDDFDGLRPVSDPDLPIRIAPLSEAKMPAPCYLVVDRMAELIVRPLREFRELGKIPEGEADRKTLPVFDNHRVARRFSARNQRIIKVPDGEIFHKAGPYLQAKNIACLLVDGQVYSL